MPGQACTELEFASTAAPSEILLRVVKKKVPKKNMEENDSFGGATEISLEPQHQ